MSLYTLDVRKYALGTCLVTGRPWGFFVARGSRVMCSDGKVRAVHRISPTADTFFSIPASVKINHKTVAGFITVETASGLSTEVQDDPAVAKFIARTYGKHAGLLPEGGWRKEAAV